MVGVKVLSLSGRFSATVVIPAALGPVTKRVSRLLRDMVRMVVVVMLDVILMRKMSWLIEVERIFTDEPKAGANNELEILDLTSPTACGVDKVLQTSVNWFDHNISGLGLLI